MKRNLYKDKNFLKVFKEETFFIKEKSLCCRMYHFLHNYKEIPKCYCGNYTNFKNFIHGYFETCSKKCRNKKENYGFYGKKHSLETKKKMSENHADFKGDKNPFKKSLKDKNNLIKHKERCKKFWASKSEKWMKNFGQKISIALSKSEKFKNQKFHKNHKTSFGEYYDEIMFFRSSWESKIAEYLFNNKFVYNFKVEPFPIPYYDYDSESLRRTKIDFKVTLSSNKYVLENSKTILLEIKPKCFFNQMKFKSIGVSEYCLENDWEFYLVNEYFVNCVGRFNKFINDIYENKYVGDWIKMVDYGEKYAV